jgi:hypothetical protein
MENIRWELIPPPPKARDLTLEAARDAGPRKSTRPLPAVQIKKMLDSRNERDVLDGLRRIVAVCPSWHASTNKNNPLLIQDDRCNMPLLPSLP